ncbi:Ppx/GppA family phosphatase [Salinisphaera sp. Q1T1-3]|nr:Ppx/GppA family phosphatase [Salinisphaera sp. Q1T1-3]
MPLKSPELSQGPLTVAAVDLGSNSFHMIVVQIEGSQRRVVDRLKESVRLAGGLDADGTLDAPTREAALACLSRFGQRLSQLPSAQVRVVGTNTLRQARHAEGFLAEAEAVLGHPIEIIYGVEEARLIYAGVCEDLAAEDEQRLVVDIGGGSTELVIGCGPRVLHAESVSLGAVSFTREFFPDGKVDKTRWRAAVTAARVALERLAYTYRQTGWSRAIGASGSVKSILRASGIEDPAGVITPDALDKLGRQVRRTGNLDKLSLPGLSAERQAIFAGGLAVLTGIFESLSVQRMAVSDKALREGVITDLLDRLAAHDARDDGVAEAVARFGVDDGHGRRVAATAVSLWRSHAVAAAAAADEPSRIESDTRQTLRWAAILHEIGLAIAHRAYHKHGQYLLENADLRGFSQADQHRLATLVRLHRGRLRAEIVDALPAAWQPWILRASVTLRLAVLLHRARNPAARPPARLSIDKKHVILTLDADWLAERPLTRADLDVEAGRLAKAGYTLVVEAGDALPIDP